jgi:hypothetical protein
MGQLFWLAFSEQGKWEMLIKYNGESSILIILVDLEFVLKVNSAGMFLKFACRQRRISRSNMEGTPQTKPSRATLKSVFVSQTQ